MSGLWKAINQDLKATISKSHTILYSTCQAERKVVWSGFGPFVCCDKDMWGLQSKGNHNILITSDTAALLSPNAFPKCQKPKSMCAFILCECACTWLCQYVCVARTKRANMIWLNKNQRGSSSLVPGCPHPLFVLIPTKSNAL